MRIEPMRNIPKCRLEFERNINIFAHQAENRKIRFLNGSGFERVIPSYTKLRALPNQRLNFLTVDVNARLMSNSMTSYFLNHKE